MRPLAGAASAQRTCISGAARCNTTSVTNRTCHALQSCVAAQSAASSGTERAARVTRAPAAQVARVRLAARHAVPPGQRDVGAARRLRVQLRRRGPVRALRPRARRRHGPGRAAHLPAARGGGAPRSRRAPGTPGRARHAGAGARGAGVCSALSAAALVGSRTRAVHMWCMQHLSRMPQPHVRCCMQGGEKRCLPEPDGAAGAGAGGAVAAGAAAARRGGPRAAVRGPAELRRVRVPLGGAVRRRRGRRRGQRDLTAAPGGGRAGRRAVRAAQCDFVWVARLLLRTAPDRAARRRPVSGPAPVAV
jgi:hypothetical protein